MTIRVSLSITDKLYDQLKYLKEDGFGSMSSIIMSSGVIGTVSDIYHMAREDEIRKQNEG